MPSRSPSVNAEPSNLFSTNGDAAQLGQMAQIAAMFSELLSDPLRQQISAEQKRPLKEHVSEFLEGKRANVGKKHMLNIGRRLRVMIRLCRASRWNDLTPLSVELAAKKKLTALRRGRRTIGPQTVNHYIQSLKVFCNWMVTNYRADRSPCRALKRLNKRIGIRRKRRALTPAEVLRLIHTTIASGAISGIPGCERAMTYLLATTTGLRSNEIQTLTRSSFHLDSKEPYLIVEAAYSKNRRESSVPLRGDVAKILRAYLSCNPRDSQLLRRPTSKPMASLREDLAAAGIEYCVNGAYADFHATRHTFISNLFDRGATPKEAQTLARHQDPSITLERYAHVTPEAQRAAVERLPAADAGDALSDLFESRATPKEAQTLARHRTPNEVERK